MRKIFEKYNPASHPFGEINVSFPVSSEKLVKVVSFEDLDEPIYVNGFSVGFLNHLPDLKIIHLNKNGGAVVLFNLEGNSFGDSYTNGFSGKYDLGLFKVSPDDRLVIECLSSVALNLYFSTGMKSVLPVYRCYEFRPITVDKDVRILRGSFDSLGVLGISNLFLNNKKSYVGSRGDFSGAYFSVLSDVYYPYHLDVSVKGLDFDNSNRVAFLVLVKDKYNRDIVQTRIHQLEAVKESFLFDAQNDYDNAAVKTFLGKNVGIERIPDMLEGLYASAFNSKYKGVYDSYVIPEGEAVEGSSSGVVGGVLDNRDSIGVPGGSSNGESVSPSGGNYMEVPD